MKTEYMIGTIFIVLPQKKVDCHVYSTSKQMVVTLVILYPVPLRRTDTWIVWFMQSL